MSITLEGLIIVYYMDQKNNVGPQSGHNVMVIDDKVANDPIIKRKAGVWVKPAGRFVQSLL